MFFFDFQAYGVRAWNSERGNRSRIGTSSTKGLLVTLYRRVAATSSREHTVEDYLAVAGELIRTCPDRAGTATSPVPVKALCPRHGAVRQLVAALSLLEDPEEITTEPATEHCSGVFAPCSPNAPAARSSMMASTAQNHRLRRTEPGPVDSRRWTPWSRSPTCAAGAEVEISGEFAGGPIWPRSRILQESLTTVLKRALPTQGGGRGRLPHRRRDRPGDRPASTDTKPYSSGRGLAGMRSSASFQWFGLDLRVRPPGRRVTASRGPVALTPEHVGPG